MNKYRIYRYNRRRYFQAAKLRVIVLLPSIVLFTVILHSTLIFTVRYEGHGMSLTPSKVYLFNRITTGFRIPFLRNQPGNRLLEKNPERGAIVAYEATHTIGAGFFRQFFDIFFSFLTLGYIQLDPRKISIKRVLGLPGETIKIKNKEIYINDKIFIPDWEIHFNDPRVFSQKVSIRDNTKGIFIPKDHVFVLSDHWSIFNDSRKFGPLPIYKIEGTLID